MRSDVRHAAQKVDRRFRVAVFQLAVRRTHAAHRLQLARHALRHSRDLFVADAVKELGPAVTHVSRSQVVQIVLRQHADAHLAGRTNRTTVDPSTAVIDLIAGLW
jgi:hypothetical protein